MIAVSCVVERERVGFVDFKEKINQDLFKVKRTAFAKQLEDHRSSGDLGSRIKLFKTSV